ncbi:MAG: tyrosine-type recombinase/integrase [Candidatus Micrarchaeota archaeon]
MDFCTAKIAEGKKPARVYKYAKVLVSWAQFLNGKRWEGLGVEEIRLAVASLERSGYAASSRVQFKAILKLFFRWLKKTPEWKDPVETEWLKCRHAKPRRYSSKEMLNSQDVHKLISATSDAKFRAFLALLYDSGMRIGEILSLRNKDVGFEPEGVSVHIPDEDGCKTGARDIFVIACIGHLRQWMDAHPAKDDPNAFVFCNGTPNSMMNYTTIQKTVKGLVEETGLKKQHNIHFFRKSRATELAIAGWSQEQLNAFFGWVTGSKMSATYVQMTAKDTRAPMQRMYGIQPKENVVSYAKNLNCEQCGGVNPAESKYCTRCGVSLDGREKAMQDAELKRLEGLLEMLKSRQAEGQPSPSQAPE